MPYLDQGEFYSEFGSYDVTISLPANYIVAASGNLQNEDELAMLKQTGKTLPEQQSTYTTWNTNFRLKALKSISLLTK